MLIHNNNLYYRVFTRLGKPGKQAFFDFRLEKLENNNYTFSPYILENLEKEQWPNGSYYVFVEFLFNRFSFLIFRFSLFAEL